MTSVKFEFWQLSNFSLNFQFWFWSTELSFDFFKSKVWQLSKFSEPWFWQLSHNDIQFLTVFWGLSSTYLKTVKLPWILKRFSSSKLYWQLSIFLTSVSLISNFNCLSPKVTSKLLKNCLFETFSVLYWKL